MKRLVLVIVGLFVLAVVAFVVVTQVQQWHARQMTAAVERERAEHDYQTRLYLEKIEDLQKEISLYKDDAGSEERLAEVLGETADRPLSDDPEIRRREAASRLAAFLDYLDGRDYMQPYLGQTNSRALFEEALTRLSEDIPLIHDEKRDLESLLRNLAHFYRVLQKDSTRMIAAILSREADIMEPVLVDAMIWLKAESAVEELPPPPDKEVLYGYAAYFLETLGGKTYLIRRGAKIRALATFYSVQILDMANDQGINVYGVDIRPHLDIALNNIQSQQGLMFKQDYLETLAELQNKYQTPSN
jgi:hypothetical protein